MNEMIVETINVSQIFLINVSLHFTFLSRHLHIAVSFKAKNFFGINVAFVRYSIIQIYYQY